MALRDNPSGRRDRQPFLARLPWARNDAAEDRFADTRRVGAPRGLLFIASWSQPERAHSRHQREPKPEARRPTDRPRPFNRRSQIGREEDFGSETSWSWTTSAPSHGFVL